MGSTRDSRRSLASPAARSRAATIAISLFWALLACAPASNDEAEIRATVDRYLSPYNGGDPAEAYGALSQLTASQLNREAYIKAGEMSRVDPDLYKTRIEALDLRRYQATVDVVIEISDPAVVGLMGMQTDSYDMEISYDLVHEDDGWRVALRPEQLAFERSRLVGAVQ